MNTNIAISGKIISVLEKSFENKKTIYAQFLMESETKGIEILKVKITNENDISKLQKDSLVSIPVSISSVNGNIFFSQIEQIRFLNKEIMK